MTEFQTSRAIIGHDLYTLEGGCEHTFISQNDEIHDQRGMLQKIHNDVALLSAIDVAKNNPDHAAPPAANLQRKLRCRGQLSSSSSILPW